MAGHRVQGVAEPGLEEVELSSPGFDEGGTTPLEPPEKPEFSQDEALFDEPANAARAASAPLALYRRYRPDNFADVIGQEHVTEPLQRALTNNRVNHAYLFSGPRGCGKTTSARILARALNCQKGRSRCRAANASPAATWPGAVRAAST